MIQLRRATTEDFAFYYALKCEKTAVYWGGFSVAPEKNGLKEFWDKYINKGSSEREILILDAGEGILIGYVQAIFESNSICLSMGIQESYRGKGYGKLIISMAIDYYKNSKSFFSYIREDNMASINCFKANGFLETSDSYRQFFPFDEKEFMMRRYELHR